MTDDEELGDVELGGEPPNEEDAPKEESALQLGRTSVYADATDACRFAIWTYLFADLREMAEQGDFVGDPEKILTLPAKFEDIMNAFTSNLENYRKQIGKDEGLYLSAAEDWIGRDEKALSLGSAANPSRVVIFDDENRESQCVYSVVVSTAMKRVIVNFRGSVTPKDWMIDVQAALRDIPNPVQELEQGQPEMVGIHHGFGGMV